MYRSQPKRLMALGRLKQGEMNKTEAAYAQHLQLLKRADEVLWYKFEGVRFVLGKKCSYTPDFMVMLPSMEIEFHEVKGFWMDDARVKIKVAAEMFPFKFVAVKAKTKREGGGWKVEEF